MRRYPLYVSGLLAAIALLTGLTPNAAPAPVEAFIHPGVSGPPNLTVLKTPEPASAAAYGDGSSSRLAILLTDHDSAWIGLAHGLKTIGVPFIITRDYQRALKHRVVLVYPTISGKVLSPRALQAIAAFPRQGGTLIAVDVLGGGLNEVFGFGEARASRRHTELRINRAHFLTAEFDDVKELTIPIGSRKEPAARMGAHSYTDPRNPPLAVYEDGGAAITQKDYASGHAYAFGMDLGFFLLKGYNNREDDIARSYVNQYEPALDVLLRLLKAMYQQGEPSAVVLHTVPSGKSLSVVLSHDLDYSHSLEIAADDYAELEKSLGVRASYFVQTKYIKDWSDEAFFNERGVAQLRRLKALGMDIGSHSVAHSVSFNQFPPGSGDERYPAYRPRVQNREQTRDGTILGELRVSKFLLEHFLGNPPVLSFRPGHLRAPYALPQALQATGYRYSSSVTANNSLTHLPFRLMHDRGVAAASGIFEFPVSVEDEEAPALGTRLPQALKLARSLERYGACMVLLIHTDRAGDKLEFERKFIQAVSKNAWVGAFDEFGPWWAARDGVTLDVDSDPASGRHTLRLQAPQSIRGLSLELPARWRLAAAQAAGVNAVQTGRRLLLAEARGAVEVVFQTAP